MTASRPTHSSVPTLMASAAFAALTTGCAIAPGSGAQAGPVILAGMHSAYKGPDAKRFHNGWELLPNTQVQLTADYPPRIPNTNVVLTRNIGMEDVELARRCGDGSTTPDPSRYAECTTATLPRQILLELTPQLVFANVVCQTPYPVVARSPGNNRVDTYLRANCATNGDYSVKSSATRYQALPVIYGGRPVAH